MSKFLFLDVETTGLNQQRFAKEGTSIIMEANDVIEIAYICEIDGIVVGKRSFKIQPIAWESISSKALEVNKTTISELRSYPEASEVIKEVSADFYKYKNIGKKGQRMVIVAHNADFDKQFLFSFFEKQGKKNDLFSMFDMGLTQCTMKLAARAKIKGKFQYVKVGLEKVAAGIGIDIEKEKLHGALYDVELCREIFKNVF